MKIELSKEQARILRRAAKRIKTKPAALAALVIQWTISECADEESGLWLWARDVLKQETDVPGWLQ